MAEMKKSGARDDWYKTAFGGDYLRVYAHRDEAEARAQVDFLFTHCGFAPGQRVVDVGCGAGRHAALLARRGCRVVGVDYSAELLAQAALQPGCGAGLHVVRGDMRSLPLRGRFDRILSLFTSFGYFGDVENGKVLGEMARVLAPGGRLVLDLPNARRVQEQLQPRSESSQQGCLIVQERRIVPGPRVEKKITISDDAGGRREYWESVRLYELPELDALAPPCGLKRVMAWGDFSGAAFGAKSERCIVMMEKRDA